jgi:pimeloyl-ACP methyl ester carboxylesterase
MNRSVRAATFAWPLALFLSTAADGAQVIANSGPSFLTTAQVSPCMSSIPYGDNAAAGHFATVNGIRLYYEIYGTGPALLVMHGNGGSIARMTCQINYFSSSHKVIAVDSRGRGKSEDGSAAYTFEQQADDFSALLEQEHVDKVDVLGHSDGGIIALVMGIRHPDKVRRIVASAPNLRPDDTALFASVIAEIKAGVAEATAKLAAGDRSRDWARQKRQLEQDLYEPHISLHQVHSIDAPTLLIGADNDLILPEHYLEIYRGLPHAHMLIIPGTTHGGLVSSVLFNPAVSRFLNEPFERPTSK